jgi:prepilin signal peptidase PulO-like enzyme (type II secretory pathway)
MLLPAIEPIAFGVCLAPAVFFDIKEKRIPDAFLIIAGLLLLLIRAATGTLRADHFLGAAAGFLSFLFAWALAGNRLGFGDVKLSGLVGFLVGAPGLIVAVFLASAGGVAVLALRRFVLRIPIGESIPFAPFLIAGGVVSYFVTGPLVSLL